MVLKPTNTDKCIKVPYIIVYLLPWFGHSYGHPWEVHYKGWISRDITEVCGQMPRCKIPFFDNTWFKTHFKI